MFWRRKREPAIGPLPAAVEAGPVTRVMPFHPRTCRLADPPTAEEEAGFEACVSASPTPSDFWQRATQADWMLDLLRQRCYAIPLAPERQLRTFALRCVDGLRGTSAPRIAQILHAVRRRADANAVLEDLRDVQLAAHGTVSAGGAQELCRFNPAAAGALAAWHAASANPYEAAFWTAEFAARHDAFLAVDESAARYAAPEFADAESRQLWHTALFDAVHPQIYQASLASARQRQAALLRRILPDPFAPAGTPVCGTLYFGPADDQGNMALYCAECGASVDQASPGMLLDVRGESCARCRGPVSRRVIH